MSLSIPNWQDPLVIPTVSPVQEGTMTPAMLAMISGGAASLLPSYTALTRPAANAVGAVAGTSVAVVWNSTDKQVNYSDGVNWYDAAGNLT